MSTAKLDAEATIAAGDWRKARVNPKYEHWYWVQPKQDAEPFLALVEKINAEGEPSTFAKTRYRYLTISDFTYWVSRSWYDRGALIVNRRRADADQGDGATFAEDWNEGLGLPARPSRPLSAASTQSGCSLPRLGRFRIFPRRARSAFRRVRLIRFAKDLFDTTMLAPLPHNAY